MTYVTTLSHKNPCPGSHEISDFGRPFLSQNCYLYIRSCLIYAQEQREKKILSEYGNNIAQMATPCQKNPASGSMKFTILGDPALVIIKISLVFLIHAKEQRRRNVIVQKPLPWGHENLLLLQTLSSFLYIFSSLNSFQEQRSRSFQKYICFTLFTPKLSPIGVAGRGGVIKDTISCLFILQILNTILKGDMMLKHYGRRDS